MQQPQFSDLLDNPDFYLFGFDNNDAVFVRMDRECYARSIFFDERIVTLDDNAIRLPLCELFAAVSKAPEPKQRIGWIFHMAHTGSTLLARALDWPGKSLVIREPTTLRALGVNAGALAKLSTECEELLNLSLRMLDRRYAHEEAVIVKANVPVNAIIPNLLERSAQPKAILLHFGLDDYLTAILRSTNHRMWVERIFAEMRLDELSENTGALSTAEKAVALWLFQIRIYAEMLEVNPDIRSLDANILFDHPTLCLKAAAEYFDCPMDDAEVRKIVSGELFSTYSKNPNAPFDNSLRQRRVAETRAGLADEILSARHWLESQNAELPLPERLAGPLCEENSLLL